MKITYLLIPLILFLSCASFKNENNEIAYRWETDELIIENGSSETVYYAVFEQDVLAVIDWFPVSTEENQLLPNSFKRINEEEIYEYEKGSTIVLFYWRGTEPPFENFESVEIDT